MTKAKKIISALLASLAISATACAAEWAPSEQIQVLARMVNHGQDGGWFVRPEQDPNFDRWFYAVTDLDHDGRLEIFKAKKSGDGVAPEIRCEELNDKCDQRTWGLFLAGGSDIPDIMTNESAAEPRVFYERADDRYNYIFVSSKELDGDEWDYVDTKVAVTLRGDLQIEDLAMVKAKLPAPGSDLAERKFFLPGWLKVEAESGQVGTPEEIDAVRYANLEKEHFPDAEETYAIISWYRAEEIQKRIGTAELPKVLESSYNAFENSGKR